MTDLWILLSVLALWFVLNLWVLPRLGMKTCLSGLCGHDSDSCSQVPQTVNVNHPGSESTEADSASRLSPHGEQQ